MSSTVSANIKVEVSIPAGSVWSEDTTITQVKKQALDGFKNVIRSINSPCVQNDVKVGPVGLVVVGEPKVEIIIINP